MRDTDRSILDVDWRADRPLGRVTRTTAGDEGWWMLSDSEGAFGRGLEEAKGQEPLGQQVHALGPLARRHPPGRVRGLENSPYHGGHLVGGHA
jgi:hypothetical protein